MDLAIVIPAYNDPRLERCLKSIDEDVEVVVVLNGATPEIKRIAKSHPVRIRELDEPNLSRAYNEGILSAASSNVLIMDSDCVFEPGTIRSLYRLLDEAPLAKGRVVFAYRSFIGKTVARARHIHTTRKNAYSPPLAFRKSIVNKIGNYYFDAELKWTEDFDFDARVQRAKLPIAYEHSAKVIHPELTLRQDLRSAFHYGTGHARGVIKQKTGYGRLGKMWAGLPKLYSLIKKKYGAATASYYVVWQISFWLGYKKQMRRMSL
ncbi:glycosyltransferase family 2 protein [Paenibacillus thiaminolyticus]|uniref:Glycosyltransferase n=1 Tax=Paenibacillus thiaminolyticus TaxID=49283 RepID=A0A3A3GMF9_PANTH|nr:glycosyltransferase [Paenibacillus thiaminolyticus]RJG26173.1 glycosyltransferase [Paenibacillus thiaminolyticus]